MSIQSIYSCLRYSFFLKGIIAQAKDANDNVEKMQLLQSKYKDILNTKRVTSHALPRIVEYLFANPIITISRTAKELKLDYHSGQNAIKTLMGMEILKKVNVNKRCGKLFVAHEILQILS